MSVGNGDGGLPPDGVVEDKDAILADTGRLMREAAALARRHGVQLHDHLAETDSDIAGTRAKFGCTPAGYADELIWLGPDVGHAQCVKLEGAGIRRNDLGALAPGMAADLIGVPVDDVAFLGRWRRRGGRARASTTARCAQADPSLLRVNTGLACRRRTACAGAGSSENQTMPRPGDRSRLQAPGTQCSALRERPVFIARVRPRKSSHRRSHPCSVR